MLTVDFIGLLFTVFLAGVRYPVHVIAAAAIHEAGRVAMALFLHGHIDSVLAAGAFGSTVASNIKAGGGPALLLALSGPLTSLIISAGTGGIAREKATDLLNPLAPAHCPFAVVNLRLACLSALYTIWNFF
ncbi:MAG TPA: hypothetical protein PKA10_11235 [Selenomonadales bacterium]|nr:hypothetical protein [Selenomonadales bacterium]